MGLLIAGALLGALDVVLVLVAAYYGGKYRIAANLLKYYVTEQTKLELELKKTVGALQEAVTPINVRLSDENAIKMAHMINYAIEQIRKSETTAGMN